MIFNVNQIEFKNKFQKDVWELGKNILPLEITLAGIDNFEMREGCTQIFNFSHELLEDIYNNTDKYEGRSADAYLAGFLCEAVKAGAVLDESGLSWKYPAIKPKWEEIYSLLAPFGFTYMYKDEYTIVKNEKYPLYLKYWYELHKLAPKGAAKRGTIGACEFRYFSKAKRQTVDDLLLGLSDKNKVCFKEVHDYVIEKGAKKETNLFRYNYKKEHIILFDKIPCILVSYKLASGNSLESFIEELNKQPDKAEIISYIEDKTECCVPCGHPLCKTSNEIFSFFPRGNRSNNRWDRGGVDMIEGIKFRLGCRYDVNKGNKANLSYDDEDIIMIKRLIDIRFAQIDNK